MNQSVAEVHIFLASAVASGTAFYPAGQRHPMLIYVRQSAGSDHNWEAAELVALKAGWSSVVIKKAGRLSLTEMESREEVQRSCFKSALTNGDALLIYETPIEHAT